MKQARGSEGRELLLAIRLRRAGVPVRTAPLVYFDFRTPSSTRPPALDECWRSTALADTKRENRGSRRAPATDERGIPLSSQ